jgi:hypothetical protein
MGIAAKVRTAVDTTASHFFMGFLLAEWNRPIVFGIALESA